MLNSNKKILILGGSGFIGRHLFSKIGQKKTVATYCKNYIEQGVYFSALKMSLSDVIKEPEIFSHAIILLGSTKVSSCAKDIEQSTFLNVIKIRKIIDCLTAWGIIPVFISTDAVFDGKKGGYIETDPVNPILTYGYQKAQVEQYMQKKCKKFIIVRLAKVFGSLRGDGTMFTSWLASIDRNETIDCLYEHISSPIHIDDAVEGLMRLVGYDCRGIYHLSNKEAYTRWDLLEMLMRYYQGYKSAEVKVVKRSIHDLSNVENFPVNISMKPDKIISDTGLAIRSPKFWCKGIVDKWFGH